MFNMDMIIELFNNYSEFAIFISIIASILIALAGVLPSIFVTGANILFWGPIKGVAISIIGEVIGGYITFKIYRLGVKRVIEKIEGRYKLIDKILISQGLNAGILIFEGRIIPFIPSGFVTLAAALSKVNDIVFILATLLGKIPSIMIEGLISYDLINIEENYIRLFMVIFALLIGYIVKKTKKSAI